MPSPPPLLLLRLWMPAHIHAIPHITRFISDLLTPRTIDGAVYNELPRVIEVYEEFLPWTFGAMDGAAARGRLDIVQTLHNTRSEGCSTDAFVKAAGNNHLHVLQWLHQFYPDKSDTVEELKAAAGGGHAQVVQYLLPSMGLRALEQSAVAAAANGHIGILRILEVWPYDISTVCVAAAAANQMKVVRFLVRKNRGKIPSACHALLKAAELEHTEMFALLAAASADVEISSALHYAVRGDKAEVVKFMLLQLERLGGVSGSDFDKLLRVAAKRNYCEMLQLLLDSRPNTDKLPLGLSQGKQVSWFLLHPVECGINLSFVSAVERGSTSVVRILFDRVSHECVGDALIRAVACKKVDVLELILDLCLSRQRSRNEHVSRALSKPEVASKTEMVKLILDKCTDFDAGHHLIDAVKRNNLGLVGVLVKSSSREFRIDALVEAAANDRLEIFKALVARCDQDTIILALPRLAVDGTSEMSKLLLKHKEHRVREAIFANAAARGFVVPIDTLINEMGSCCITRALTRAATRGHTEVVEVLSTRSDPTTIHYALLVAAMEGRVGVVELLRDQCDEKSIIEAQERAKMAGFTDVVHILTNKRRRLAL